MSVFHVISSQTFDQVKHYGHVSNFLSKRLPAFNEADFFIDTLDLIWEAFILLDENIGLDLSPKFGLPIIVLQIDQSDKIPKGLKILQIRETFLERLIVSSFKFEKIFKFGILSGLLFEF